MTAPDTAEVDFVTAFVDTAEELVSGLAELFPECPEVAKKLKKLRSFLKTPDVLDPEGRILQKGRVVKVMAIQVMREWHVTMKDWYNLVTNREIPQLLESKLPILEELDIGTKWKDPDFGAESRDNLFRYIDLLNYCAQSFCEPDAVNKVPPPQPTAEVTEPEPELHFSTNMTLDMMQTALTEMQTAPLPKFPNMDPERAQQMLQSMGVNPEQMMQNVNPEDMMQRMQSALPPNMLRNIEGVARQMAEKMANGESSMQALDMDTIMSMGQTVMQGTSPEDMMHVMSNMHKIMPLLNMNQMMPPGMAPGGADMTMMFRMFRQQ